jgi:hypothetical protein
MDPPTGCMIVPMCSWARKTTLRSIPAQRAFVNHLVRIRMPGGVGPGAKHPRLPDWAASIRGAQAVTIVVLSIHAEQGVFFTNAR